MGLLAGYLKKNKGGRPGKESFGLMMDSIKCKFGEYNKSISLGNCDMGLGMDHGGTMARQFYLDSEQEVSVLINGDIFDVDDSSVPDQELANDARLVALLYQRYGKDFVREIDGSFVLSLYDKKSDQLLLVRDRLGTKPLYYFECEDAVLWGSEIKSVLSSDRYHRKVDPVAVNLFFSYGFLPNPSTLFKGIKQVRPGHVLVCDRNGVREDLYWKFEYKNPDTILQDNAYIEKFRSVFESAVSKRLKKYPDAGAFLSGGLDTSSVVAIMHQLVGNQFKVFTAGFHEKAYNEIEEAKLLSGKFGLEHFTTLIGFDENFPAFLEELVELHEQPFSDTSAIPSYYVAKLAKEYVDTVLTGDFPDQLLGGSGHHRWALDREKNDPGWKRMLKNENLPFNKFATRFPFSAGTTSLKDKVIRALYRETFSLEEQRVMLSMPIQPYLRWLILDPKQIKSYKAIDPLSLAKRCYMEVKDKSLLDKILYYDINFYAIDNLNVKVNRMCRAHNLKAISPFWDKEMVELGASLPPGLKIREGNQKLILRESMRSFLPEQTLNKKKQGFAMPIGEWLIRKMQDFVGDTLLDPSALNRGYFNKKFMKTMVENFLAGKNDYATGSESTIISLITFELWHRHYMD